MSRDRRSSYKGTDVTVRWVEVESVAGRSPRFTGSWSLEPHTGEEQVWHNLPDFVFITSTTAASYALQQARLAIDASEPA